MDKNLNHQADIKNANKGAYDSNTTYVYYTGNRGKQLISFPKGKR